MDRYLAVRQRLRGPVLPLNVPYSEDDRLDLETVERYVDWACNAKVPVILLTFGSTEYSSLTDQEIYELTRVVGRTVAGRSLFVAGSGFWPVAEILRYIEFAEEHGADAVKVHLNWWMAPYREEDLVAYYREIGQRVSLPLLAYTLGAPGITPSLLARLAAEVPQVVGIKNDSDPFYGYFDYIRMAGDRMEIISGGQMKSMLYGYLYGSRSYLCPFVPFAPAISLEFYRRLEAGEFTRAAEFVTRYEAPFLDAAGSMGWFSMIKAVLYARGLFRTPRMRLPFHTAGSEQVDAVRALLEQLGI